MKKAWILCTGLCLASYLFPFEYVMNANPSSIGSQAGDVQVTTLTGGTWDDGYVDLAVPASHQFYFYGKKVNLLRVFVNGVVILGFDSIATTSGTAGNNTIPYMSSPNNIAAPMWDDWDLRTTGGLYYKFFENGSYKLIVVEWRAVPHYGAAGTAYTFSTTFLCSTHPYHPNAVLFYYGDVDSANASYDFGASATVGVKSSLGNQGELFSFNQALLGNGMKILFTPFVPVYGSTTDQADADGHPDSIIFRPSNGMWYNKNTDGTTDTMLWGQKGDVPLPGDYDGDGDSDECVFRPANSTWYGSAPTFTKSWGATGDIPVPADYDGDGLQDLAVFRAYGNKWYIFYRGSGTSAAVTYGTAGDIPMPGDYDNDGKADVAVYRPANNKWYVRKSSDLTTVSKTWGADGDIPLAASLSTADAMVTVYRPSTGFFHAASVTSSTTYSRQWGQDGDVPVPCDENVGGITDVAVFRPAANAHWYISSPSYLPADFIWGTLGDKPRYRSSNVIASPAPSKKDR